MGWGKDTDLKRDWQGDKKLAAYGGGVPSPLRDAVLRLAVDQSDEWENAQSLGVFDADGPLLTDITSLDDDSRTFAASTTERPLIARIDTPDQSRNVLQFASGNVLTSDAAASAWAFLNGEHTLIFVVRVTDSDAGTLAATYTLGASEVGFSLTVDNYVLTAGVSNGSSESTVTHEVTADELAVITVRLDSGALELRVDGELVRQSTEAEATAASPHVSASTPASTLTIGEDFPGEICEVTAFNTALGDDDLLSAEQYLAMRWLRAPIGFHFWKPDFVVNVDGTTTFDYTAAKGTPDTTYYVDQDATGAADGSTWADAFTTLSDAQDAVRTGTDDAYQIVCREGDYQDDFYAGWHPDGKTVHLVVEDGGAAVVLRNDVPASGYTWTAVSDYYQATIADCHVLVPEAATADRYGNDTPLTRVFDLGDLVEGAWYASGSTVSVHMPGDVEPGANLRVFEGSDYAGSISNVASGTIVFENFTFEGGLVLTGLANNTATVVFDDCKFAFSRSNGLSGYYTTAITRDCTACHCRQDGFGYNGSYVDAYMMRVLEESCLSYGHGMDNAHINNPSTAHSGMAIIRAGGTYVATEGPQITDVGGSQSWCVRCTSGNSVATSAVRNAFFVQSSLNGSTWARSRMWLERCNSVQDIGGAVAGGSVTTDRCNSGAQPSVSPTNEPVLWSDPQFSGSAGVDCGEILSQRMRWSFDSPPSVTLETSNTAAKYWAGEEHTFSGVASPGVSVGIYINDTLLNTVTANASTGAFSYDWTVPETPAYDGANAVAVAPNAFSAALTVSTGVFIEKDLATFCLDADYGWDDDEGTWTTLLKDGTQVDFETEGSSPTYSLTGFGTKAAVLIASDYPSAGGQALRLDDGSGLAGTILNLFQGNDSDRTIVAQFKHTYLDRGANYFACTGDTSTESYWLTACDNATGRSLVAGRTPASGWRAIAELSTTYSINTEYIVAFVQDGTAVTLYVDSGSGFSSVATGTLDVTTLDVVDHLLIGARSKGSGGIIAHSNIKLRRLWCAASALSTSELGDLRDAMFGT